MLMYKKQTTKLTTQITCQGKAQVTIKTRIFTTSNKETFSKAYTNTIIYKACILEMSQHS